MRAIFIFLSIGLVFTIVRNGNGSPIRLHVWESEEDDGFELNNQANFAANREKLDDDDGTWEKEKDYPTRFHENDHSSEENHTFLISDDLIENIEGPSDHRFVHENDVENDAFHFDNVISDEPHKILQDDEQE